MTLYEQTEQLRKDVLARMPQPIVQNFKNDIHQLRVDKMKENALQVGDIISNSNLENINQNSVKLEEFLTSDFLILNFYRGGWCPYCNMELREYEKLKNDFQKINTNIIAISGEIPELASKTTDKNAISFPILTDVDANFMKSIGIVFALSEQAQKDFVGFGMDFKQINGNENFELPVPAIYVIDKNFKIVFVHFEEDYMTRLEPKELLNILTKKIN
ncbi:MAG: peroxiredoxin [Polaribacter sp.]|jgi:peroxiredoxin